MKIKPKDQLDDIRSTVRYRDGVEGLAQRLKSVSSENMEQLIKALIDDSEHEALGILFLVITINRTPVNFNLLISGAKIIDNIYDAFAPFRYLPAEAVPALIQMAESEEISWQRQAYAALMAAYLIRKFSLEKKELTKTLKKLELDIDTPDALSNIYAAREALDEATDLSEYPYSSYFKKPMDVLPENRPQKVIASGYTVKRSIAKVNRNAPCPCGSGKKYKKCCMRKDESSRISSPEREIVSSENIYQPAKLTGEAFIDNLRPFELVKLIPGNLDNDQLLWAYRRLSQYGHYEKAYEMLLELESNKEDFDDGHFYDFLYDVFNAGNLELAEKIIPKIKDESFYDKELIEFKLYLLKNKAHLQQLEEMCMKCLQYKCEFPELCHIMYSAKFPAIFIMFFRTLVASYPERFLDIDVLIESVQKARIDLELDEIDDPGIEYWEMLSDSIEQNKQASKQLTENIELKNQLKDTQIKAGKIGLELSRREKEIQKLEKRKRDLEESASKEETNKTRQEDTVSADEEIERLRRRSKNLQAELKHQQDTRQELRQQIRSSRVTISNLLKEKKGSDPVEKAASQAAGSRRLPETIVVPEYLPNFRKQAEQLPAEIVAKALTAANGIVLNKPEVWKQTTSIETYDDLYRVRLGLQYRLMLRWKPGKFLHVLDIIPRNKLETWLKQL